jgi:hypothetical protein
MSARALTPASAERQLQQNASYSRPPATARPPAIGGYTGESRDVSNNRESAKEGTPARVETQQQQEPIQQHQEPIQQHQEPIQQQQGM